MKTRFSKAIGAVSLGLGVAFVIPGASAAAAAARHGGAQSVRAPHAASAGGTTTWIGQKVAASDGAPGDFFGWSVAVDGATAVVGADYATVGGNAEQGAAYVFVRWNGTWHEVQKLTADDGAAVDKFGYSVAVSGSTVVVGAPGATVNGNWQQGAAYVFTESGGSWSQAAKLTASDGEPLDGFGHFVAASAGFLMAGTDRQGTGAVYVFAPSQGGWSQTQELAASDGAAIDRFGSSIALSGTTAVIGAPGATVDGHFFQGAAYVFDESNGSWTQSQKLTASDGAAYDGFGGVALSGTTAIISAPGAKIGANYYQGAAYVFEEQGGTWTQTQKLTAADGGPSNYFGLSPTMDGSTALIGSLVNTVYEFAQTGGTWSQVQELKVSGPGGAAYFGSSVGLSGTTALAGAYDTQSGDQALPGLAYFFGETDLGLSLDVPGTVGAGQTYLSQTIVTDEATVASPAIAVTVTVPAAATFVSASASSGFCTRQGATVLCRFGQVLGNGGTASANVTLKAIGNAGDTIGNTTSVVGATPALSASAPTLITACPDSYTEYDGTLDAGGIYRSPSYTAPAGQENAILDAAAGFRLYLHYSNGGAGHVYRIPGNEIHRNGPAGTYFWAVQAGAGGGGFTLCIAHP